MSKEDEWSPDEALGTETFRQGDAAFDEESRLNWDFTDAVQGDPSIDPENELDELELEEAGVALDDPEMMLILQGGGGDPDGMGRPPRSAGARAPEEPGWDLDGANSSDDDEAPGKLTSSMGPGPHRPSQAIMEMGRRARLAVRARGASARGSALDSLCNEIVACRRCPRLVAWREQVAGDKRAAFIDQDYWGRPVPGFGDPAARVLLVGLAPAAHGGNRTGRVFTGDRSGDWLFAALWRTGFANQPESVAVDDGLVLSDAYVVAAVRCAPPANKPTPPERDACVSYLRRELSLLTNVRVVVALGHFAHQIVAGELGIRPRPQFGHGAEAVAPDGTVLLSSYHPSQRNTFTGTLTGPMFDDVLVRARHVADDAATLASLVHQK